MFKRPQKEQSKIQQEMEVLQDELDAYDVSSKEYADVLKQLELLYELDKKVKVSIDPNTALVVAGNLLGILAILKHEQFNVITSKAMSFVIKGRV